MAMEGDDGWDLFMLDSGASCNTFISQVISFLDPITKFIQIGTASSHAQPLTNSTSGFAHFQDVNGSHVHFGESKSYGGVRGVPRT